MNRVSNKSPAGSNSSSNTSHGLLLEEIRYTKFCQNWPCFVKYMTKTFWLVCNFLFHGVCVEQIARYGSVVCRCASSD